MKSLIDTLFLLLVLNNFFHWFSCHGYYGLFEESSLLTTCSLRSFSTTQSSSLIAHTSLWSVQILWGRFDSPHLLHIAQLILSGKYLPCFIFFLEGDTFLGNKWERMYMKLGNWFNWNFVMIICHLWFGGSHLQNDLIKHWSLWFLIMIDVIWLPWTY